MLTLYLVRVLSEMASHVQADQDREFLSVHRQNWNPIIQALPVDERPFWQRAFDVEAHEALEKMTAGDFPDRGQSHNQIHRISDRSKRLIETLRLG